MKVNKSDNNPFGAKANIYKSNFFSEPVMTREGFLVVDTILARKVVMPYQYFDLEGEPFIQQELMGDAIFSPQTIASADGLPFVVLHPEDPQGNFIEVTPENFNQFMKGITFNPRIVNFEGEDMLIATLKIFDEETQKRILSKELKEVSQGYFSNTKKKKGVYNGVNYEAEQTDIIFNHLALVPEGRAGDAVRLLFNKNIDKEITNFVHNAIHNSKPGVLNMLYDLKGNPLFKIVDGKPVFNINTGDIPPVEDEKKKENTDDVTPVDPVKENNPELNPGQTGGNDMTAFLMQLIMGLVGMNNTAPVNQAPFFFFVLEK